MAQNVDITGARSSYQAAFALYVITAGVALVLLALATRPTIKRIKARRFSIRSKDRPTPLKTSLGTYLFLWPALLFFFTAYTLKFVADLLKTSGTIDYDGGLALHGNRPFNGGRYEYSTAILSLVSALFSIFVNVLINGGVWIYSTHTLANGTGRQAPSLKSKIYNTFIMLAILGTGLAAWAYGVNVRNRTFTWSSTVHNNKVTRDLFVVYRTVVVAASLSVSIQVVKELRECSKNSRRDSPERKNLQRFAYVVVPLIWLRDAFIIYDIVLVYVNTAAWSRTSVLASQFLLIVFGQIFNLTILGMILYGAWRTGRTVPVFDRME